LLLAAFVMDIRPDLNWLRLILFNVGAIAVGFAVAVRATAPGPAVASTAAAVIITNAAHLGMTVLSLRIERPFAGDFGLVFSSSRSRCGCPTGRSASRSPVGET
jgi:hypothetical protein